MPSETISQPRRLLRRLHGVMASSASAQERLDRVVRVIAQNMVAEVCSIYLARAGNVLELFATEGLKRDAVHNTRMSDGEGLVGLVAERGLSLNLQEAQRHPRFSLRPETGEEPYNSFLGVPIMRDGKAIGVLTVQNVARRRYTHEEMEVLQTIAMVLAEMIWSGNLIPTDELHQDTLTSGVPITLDGISFAPGMAFGETVFHRPRVHISRAVAEDEEAELTRLNDALQSLRDRFSSMLEHPDLAHGGAHRQVLETFSMFAEDQGWERRLRAAVQTGLTAEAAAQRVQQDTATRMATIRDPYLRERIGDFEELTLRLLQELSGDQDQYRAKVTTDSILVARNLGAADLLEYDRQYLKGVVLEEGSQTAHITVIARALGIPLLGRVHGLLGHVAPGEPLIVDTNTKHLYVRPADDVIEIYRAAEAQYAEQRAQFQSEVGLNAETRDGTKIDLFMNAGLLVDLPHLSSTGAEGIGLFRTEFQFMVAPSLPKVEEQRKIYAAAIEAAGPDRPVYFRTLDIGGDKQAPFLPRTKEENPAMGWRAIRIAMDRPALLRYQLRALMLASAGQTLHVMFPMIAEVSELKRCKSMVQKELKRAKENGKEYPTDIKVGCMIEVPSLVFQMDQLAQEVDFLSVGTNDLMQFFYASDRGSPNLTGRYDLLAPHALRLMKTIVDSAAKYNVPVSVCGESAGRPIDAMALLGLGVRRLSVAATAVGPVKRLIRQLDLATLSPFILDRMEKGSGSIRESLKHFARDRGIEY